MQTISISVGPELFIIASFEVWKYRAKEMFEGCGHHPRRTVAVDSRGRVCVSYREFEFARDRGSFPIRVYGIAEEPEAAAAVLAGKSSEELRHA
jgi:hypothetical protein